MFLLTSFTLMGEYSYKFRSDVSVPQSSFPPNPQKLTSIVLFHKAAFKMELWPLYKLLS